MPSPNTDSRQPYDVVAAAIEYIHSHARQQPSLGEIAAAMQLSESHLQRIFSSWAGISPKRFLQYLTKEHARQQLQRNTNLLDTTLESGLSSPGRLHDLMVTWEAMTPGEIRRQGEGVKIGYGLCETPFGMALMGWTPRGLCYMAFYDGTPDSCLAELAGQWPRSERHRDDQHAAELCRRVFPDATQPAPVHLLLKGTPFQLKVWEALISTHPSQLLSYGQLAQRIDKPNAQRAVGSAVAANTLAFLIPCHRVIRESGESGNFRWGSERKQAIQLWEAAQTSDQTDPD